MPGNRSATVKKEKPKKIERLEERLELEDVEAVVGHVDEKTDEAASGEETEESLSEEMGLDDEELNPFGDKWEE